MADNDAQAPAPTLLLTRPRAAATRFALEASARWPDATVVISPLMEIAAVGEVPRLDAIDGVIFSSANAVARIGPGRGLPAWCVGARTAEAALEAGFQAEVAGETADEMVAHLAAERPAGRILHLHGVHQRGDAAGRLAKAGLSVEGVVVYDQRSVAPDTPFFDALAARPLIVPLFSPRSATLFAEAAEAVLGPVPPDGVAFVALSGAVCGALPDGWHDATRVAGRPDAAGMLDEIARRITP